MQHSQLEKQQATMQHSELYPEFRSKSRKRTWRIVIILLVLGALTIIKLN